MNKYIVSLIVGAVILLCASATNVDANYNPYEGHNPSLNILLDKQVCHPYEDKGSVNCNYVDNLSSNDFRYSPMNFVYFRLRVKNTSKETLNNVVIKDYAPDHVDMLENPGKVSNNTLTLEVGTLAPDEEKIYVIKGRVRSQDNLPSDRGIICVVNRAVAENGSVSDGDSSEFCIEKKITSSTGTSESTPSKIPSTGPEHGVLISLVAGALAYTGFKLRRVGL